MNRIALLSAALALAGTTGTAGASGTDPIAAIRDARKQLEAKTAKAALMGRIAASAKERGFGYTPSCADGYTHYSRWVGDGCGVVWTDRTRCAKLVLLIGGRWVDLAELKLRQYTDRGVQETVLVASDRVENVWETIRHGSMLDDIIAELESALGKTKVSFTPSFHSCDSGGPYHSEG